MKKVLYIGWIGYRNLGDELMFDLFKQKTAALGGAYAIDAVNSEPRYLRNVRPEDYDLIVLGGGSLLSGPGDCVEPYVFDLLSRAVRRNRPVMIWGSGVDWAPRSLLASLSHNGGPLPLEVSDELREQVREVFDRSVWAGVRGPLTLALLRRLGVSDRLQISGDPAFLIQPEDAEPLNVRYMPQRGKIVGVNWGTTFNRVYGADEAAVENELAAALKELIDRGYAVYFYLLWGADLAATERLYNMVRGRGTVVLDPTLYHQNGLLTVLRNFSFTINFKLHANYISLAAKVPFIALGYRFKIFDFARSVDLNHCVVPTDSPRIRERILELAAELEDGRDEVAEKLAAMRAAFADKIGEPFDHGLFI